MVATQRIEGLTQQGPATATRIYRVSRTAQAFHDDDSFVRGIMGPIGSGKSTACVMEIMLRSAAQRLGPKGPDGRPRRRSRWVVVRNTYRELADTTVRTFLDWVPETPGSRARRWRASDMLYEIRDVELELDVLFRALDRPDDIKKLLSLELTGAWVNEAREVPKAVIDMLAGRVGRFPPAREEGCSWSGIILDTNPPDTDHWWYETFEEKRPQGWRLFRQPSGRSPQAENLKYLPPNYYGRLMADKTDEWVKVYVDGEYGFVREGKIVYPEYVDSVHCSPAPLEPISDLPLLLGWDFGLTPSCLVGQRTPSGRWLILREYVFDDMGVQQAAEHVRAELNREFGDWPCEGWGDPAGTAKAQTDEKTCFQILGAAGLDIRPAPSQDLTLRRESVAAPMRRLVDGKPGFQIDPRCKVLRKGFQGGYCYRRVQVSGEDRYQDKPDKNRYSHPHDALQYLMSGAGEGERLVRPIERPKPSWRDELVADEGAYDWLTY